VARLITPMMAAYLLKPKPATILVNGVSAPIENGNGNGNGSGNGQQFAANYVAVPKAGPYRRLLTAALRHRFLTLAIAVGIFFGSLQLVPYIPTSLFESSDSGLSTISVELPPGSTLADTQAATEQLSEGTTG
jgi:multidrug efflux pump subunit AcrB